MKKKLIIDLIKKEISDIIEQNYGLHTTRVDMKQYHKPVTFILSNLYIKDKQEKHELILTLSHCGYNESEIISLYTDLNEVIETLYNRTM